MKFIKVSKHLLLHDSPKHNDILESWLANNYMFRLNLHTFLDMNYFHCTSLFLYILYFIYLNLNTAEAAKFNSHNKGHAYLIALELRKTKHDIYALHDKNAVFCLNELSSFVICSL